MRNSNRIWSKSQGKGSVRITRGWYEDDIKTNLRKIWSSIVHSGEFCEYGNEISGVVTVGNYLSAEYLSLSTYKIAFTNLYVWTIFFAFSSSFSVASTFNGFVIEKKCFARPQYVLWSHRGASIFTFRRGNDVLLSIFCNRMASLARFDNPPTRESMLPHQTSSMHQKIGKPSPNLSLYN